MIPAPRPSYLAIASVLLFTSVATARVIELSSPDGRNRISLHTENDDGELRYSVHRDERTLVKPSLIDLKVVGDRQFTQGASVLDVRSSDVDDRFELLWGKTRSVRNRCRQSIITLKSRSGVTMQFVLRAYDDGVAFRYQFPRQESMDTLRLLDEATEINFAGQPTVLFNTLDHFKTSHESLYRRGPLSTMPVQKLVDMPMLVTWPKGMAAAVTEARVRGFAGAYLQRSTTESTSLRLRIAPQDGRQEVVVRSLPCESPWRVVLMSDRAGELLESNLLLCLNDPPQGDFAWLQPGKTTFHWWNGEFEQDHKLPPDSDESLERHRRYIDFCADNKIAYHGLSGDGYAWYKQPRISYGAPSPDADVRVPRPEIKLFEVLDYAKKRGVGIRLWVHWKPLSQHLEEAFTLYEEWGVRGLMVDFMDRDDQEMIEFLDRLLECAARHKLHIQLHGSAKYSGEQRTFPNLFNREGVLNLEYLKWSDLCTPDHNVNVAYTRALAGPVDYHQGGFRSIGRGSFQPRDLHPFVLGTRCHHLAMYVVYENPMPMVADTLEAYEGQPGFDFVSQVPTTWDETRFIDGVPGEFVILARRKEATWYVAGMTNWTAREVEVPLEFLQGGPLTATLYRDGSMDESKPNAIEIETIKVAAKRSVNVSLAAGGGFALAIEDQAK